MPKTTIREIQGEEMLDIMYWLNNYAFMSSPPMPDKTKWQERISKRLKNQSRPTFFALFEDDEPLAAVATSPLTQNVRGALFGMGGIWGVATHPNGRRKGYSRRVLAKTLAFIQDDERPLSCLYPFRESFYERLGYATFPQPRTVRFSPTTLAPLLKKDLEGEVELSLIGESYDAYLDYLHKIQGHTHGMAVFERDQKEDSQRNNYWLAQARVDGEVVGVMMYDLRGEELMHFKLTASRFYYHTSQGRYLLLAWIARHIDQADRVELRLPPFEHPETWQADMEIEIAAHFVPPMGRVVDVAKIGGMQTSAGHFSARVRDSLCPWNEGVWQFETVNGQLQVSKTDDADCDLNIQALAALVYGTHDPGDFAIKDWGTPPPAVQTVMRTMFPRLIPYLHESY